MPLSSALSHVVREYPFGEWLVTLPVPAETHLEPAVAAHLGLPYPEEIPPAFHGLRDFSGFRLGMSKGLLEPVLVLDGPSEQVQIKHADLAAPPTPPGHVMVDVHGFDDKRHAVRFAFRARQCLAVDFAYVSHVVMYAGVTCRLEDLLLEVPRLRRREFRVLTDHEQTLLDTVAPGDDLRRNPNLPPRPPSGMDWGQALRTGEKTRAEYRASPEWKAIRAQRWRVDGGACCRCGAIAHRSGERFDCHHVENARYGEEELDDLRIVCRFCHDDIHGVRGEPRPDGWPIPETRNDDWVNRTHHRGG